MPKAKAPKNVTATTDTVAAKKSGKTKTRTKKTAQVTAPVPVEVVETNVVEKQTDTTDSSVTDLSDSFQEFIAKMQAVCSSMQSLKTEFRGLEKRFNRELKAAQKAASKKKRKTGNRQPSGFVKPTLISTELAKFLGKPEGTEMARTEVTREINAYIRKHSLQDKDNGRVILADSKLRKLLKLKKDDELTYFNLQRYMSPHFAKNTKVASQ